MATIELEARIDNLLSTAQAEMANVDLFVPISEREECPICLIPLPFEGSESHYYPCCGKCICKGCSYKSIMSKSGGEIEQAIKRLRKMSCSFCRQPIEMADIDKIKSLEKLMKKNDPEAFMQMAKRYKIGDGVLQSDTRHLEMRISAAELGNAEAFGYIAGFCLGGIVVEQNTSKAWELLEVGAKKGSISAHESLARQHQRRGNTQTSIKHLKVVANAGGQQAMNGLMKAYREKALSKEDLTQVLRAFQTSSNEMKSKDRDDARAFMAVN